VTETPPAMALRPNRPIAAIDIGSNSIHLTLARVVDGRIDTLLCLKDPARLAAQLDRDSSLSAEAITKAVATLGRFRDLANVHGAEVRAAATATLRAARNRDDFLTRAATDAGVEVELITGHTEARLAYLGVRHGLPRLDGRTVLTVDVGGGSTDLARGTGPLPDLTASIPLGSLAMTHRYLSDPITKPKLRKARQILETAMAEPLKAIKAAGFGEAIATSGSIQRLARLLHPDLRSLHGIQITTAELDRVGRELAQARTTSERKRLPGMDPERADSLLGGVMVFQVMSRLLGIERWTVSVTALRTGVILDTWRRRAEQNP
jgi:exopolyphosphatase/guanosine-5'-triphosphate,3'-diphosphate pyrophosphatase